MNQSVERTKSSRFGRWLSERTRLPEIICGLFDEPSAGFDRWLRTTAGIVAMLLAVQVVTGVLLAFYFVPSTEAAHATVSYIEKALPAGSWIRALHHYGSQWLTLFLVLHLAQMFWRASYRTRPVAWISTVLLLALIFAGGVTGYSLPWDARAFFGTKVADGIASGVPLIGKALHRWLLGGEEITTITLSRFFALHALVVPSLVLLVMAARFLVLREPDSNVVSDSSGTGHWRRQQFARQSIVAGLAFLALALYALKYHAPLGPSAAEVASGYMPRPGAQFLWLFQMLKYLPGGIASIVGAVLPGLIFIGLGSLPFLEAWRRRKTGVGFSRRRLSGALFVVGCLLIATMTVLAYFADRRDQNARAKLERQAAEEAEFRAKPFEPVQPKSSSSGANESGPQSGNANANVLSVDKPPAAYTKKCASCHGTRGQGAKSFPTLQGVSAKPRRSVEEIIGLLNDPVAYGLEPPMRSFATKLTDAEKREIAEWLMILKK